MFKKKIVILMVLFVLFSLPGRINAFDKNFEIISGSDKYVVDFSCRDEIKINERCEILIIVYDKSYIHKKFIDGEEKATVNFLVFHNNKSGWGKSIRAFSKEKFKGPGGYVERTYIPLTNINDKWIGEVTIIPRRSTQAIAVWKNKNNGKVYYGIKIIRKQSSEDKILSLANSEPTIEEVIKSAKTPEQLVTFINNYFSVEFHEGRKAYKPEKFLNVQHGDCKDFALFAESILHKSGYKTKRFEYSPTLKPGGHVITLYWIGEEIYYITSRLNDVKIYGPFDSVHGVLEQEVKRRPDLNEVPKYYKFCPIGELTCPPLDE